MREKAIFKIMWLCICFSCKVKFQTSISGTFKTLWNTINCSFITPFLLSVLSNTLALGSWAFEKSLSYSKHFVPLYNFKSAYGTFFQVLRRIIGSMVPVYSKNYLVSFIRPNPDLYGKHYLRKIYFTYSIK